MGDSNPRPVVQLNRFPSTTRRLLRILLAAALIAISSGLTAHSASAETSHIYWTNQTSGTIERADIDGSNRQTWISDRSSPSALVSDGTYLYWTESSGSANPATGIYRALLADSSTVTQIVVTDGLSYGVAVNATHLYWSESWEPTNGEVVRANLDGSGMQVVATGLERPEGLALNDTQLFIAEFRDGTSTGRIIRTDLDGSNPATIVATTELNGVDDVTVDSTHLYYSQSNAQAIGRALLDGSSADNTFMTSTGQTNGITTYRSKLLWASFSVDEGIWQSNLDGTGRTQLITSTGAGPIDVIVVPGTGLQSESGSFAEFTFVLPDGRECSSISPQRVQVGTMVQLPGESALCQTSDGSLVAGWVIPVP